MKRVALMLLLGLAPFVGRAQQGTLDYKTTLAGARPDGARPDVSRSDVSAPGATVTSRTYIANGNVRVEASIAMPGMAMSLRQATLLLADKPTVTYLLDERRQVYTDMPAKSTGKNGAVTVKRVGTENVLGMNCTHVVATTGKTQMDLWTTKDIRGYDKLLNYRRVNPNLGSEAVHGQLKKLGADGIVVKSLVKTDKGSVTTELLGFDPRPPAASLFVIPKTYRKVSVAEYQKGMQGAMGGQPAPNR